MPKWTDKPWERQKGESEKAFEAFVTYRDMGEKRTLTAVAEKLQKSGTLIRRWKSAWDWAEPGHNFDESYFRSIMLPELWRKYGIRRSDWGTETILSRRTADMLPMTICM